MKKKLLVLCAVLMLAVLQGCSRGSSGVKEGTDLEFAKTAFAAMTSGDASAEQYVDWDHFQSVGVNVGTQYAALTDEAQKAAFRKAFLASFSASFRSTGASADSVSNWRVQSQDASQTIVAADTIKKTVFLITVSKSNGQKVAALGLGK